MEILVLLAFWIVPIVVGYVSGRIVESRHYRSIEARERQLLHLPATTFRKPVGTAAVERVELVSGGVVVSVDYFKQAAAALRSVVGGPVKSHETLLDRAKREAVLRLKESCPHADEIINVRLETAPISKNRQGGIGAVEVFAYGTALYFTGNYAGNYAGSAPAP